MEKSDADQDPGKGIRGTRTTGVFRVVNFELFARPVSSYITQLYFFFTLMVTWSIGEGRQDGMFFVWG